MDLQQCYIVMALSPLPLCIFPISPSEESPQQRPFLGGRYLEPTSELIVCRRLVDINYSLNSLIVKIRFECKID
jgi:hypothetical protein